MLFLSVGAWKLGSSAAKILPARNARLGLARVEVVETMDKLFRQSVVIAWIWLSGFAGGEVGSEGKAGTGLYS